MAISRNIFKNGRGEMAKINGYNFTNGRGQHEKQLYLSQK
jgi:hypothetical protein